MKSLAQTKQEVIASIDAAAAEIYDLKNAFAKAYSIKESQAAAYQAANYTGTVPAQIQSYADDAGITAQQAADNVLASAAQMHQLIDHVEAARLKKIQVANATTRNQLNSTAKPILDNLAAIYAQVKTL